MHTSKARYFEVNATADLGLNLCQHNYDEVTYRELAERLVLLQHCAAVIRRHSGEEMRRLIIQELAGYELRLLQSASGFDELQAYADGLVKETDPVEARKELSQQLRYIMLAFEHEIQDYFVGRNTEIAQPHAVLIDCLVGFYNCHIEGLEGPLQFTFKGIDFVKEEVPKTVSDLLETSDKCREGKAAFVRDVEKFCGFTIKHTLSKGASEDLKLNALYRRAKNPSYVIRRLKVLVKRNRETLFLRLGLIRNGKEHYVSNSNVLIHQKILASARDWAMRTYLVPAGEEFDEAVHTLTLADCMKTPAQIFSKLYAITSQIAAISEDYGLACGMLTLTLEPEWHPNPQKGNGGKWNGRNARAANNEIKERWKKVLIDINNKGIHPTGLRVVEPHKDGCPHWHVWIHYDKSVERELLASCIKHYGGPLKYRTSTGSSIFESCRQMANRDYKGRAEQERDASTLLDFTLIDGSKSKAASYLLKYLLKSLPVQKLNSDELTDQEREAFEQAKVDIDEEDRLMFSKQTCSPEVLEATKSMLSTLERNAAYRSTWQMRGYDFFGLARCLSIWDELRRLNEPPGNSFLYDLWVMARGTKIVGRIKKGSGIRGDAKAFLLKVGGIRAVEHLVEDIPAGKELRVKLWKSNDTNSNGEPSKKIKGLLVEELTAVTDTSGKKPKTKLVWNEVYRQPTREMNYDLYDCFDENGKEVYQPIDPAGKPKLDNDPKPSAAAVDDCIPKTQLSLSLHDDESALHVSPH